MTRKKVKIVWGKSDNDEIDIKKVAPSQLDRELEELQQEMNLAFSRRDFRRVDDIITYAKLIVEKYGS